MLLLLLLYRIYIAEFIVVAVVPDAADVKVVVVVLDMA